LTIPRERERDKRERGGYGEREEREGDHFNGTYHTGMIIHIDQYIINKL